MSEDMDVGTTGLADPSTTAPDPGSTAEPVVETPTQEQPRTFTQAELDREIGKRLERQERKIRRELVGLVREQVRPPEQPQEPKVEPKLDQFKDWDAYNQALIDHRVEQRLAEREQRNEAKQRDQVSAQRQGAIAKEHQERVASAKERYEDFDDVVDPILELTVPSHVVDLIAGADRSADLMYKLGENPKEYLRIAKLGPVAAARELAKLEASIADPVKKASSAPAPVTPLNGQATDSSVLPSDKDDDATWRRKELLRMKKAGKRPV